MDTDMIDAISLDDPKAKFTAALTSHFNSLIDRGFAANDAAILGVQIMSGTIKPPLEVTTLIKEVDLARNGARSEPLFQKLKSLFSSRETTVLSFLRTGSAAKASQEGNAKQAPQLDLGLVREFWSAIKRLRDAADAQKGPLAISSLTKEVGFLWVVMVNSKAVVEDVGIPPSVENGPALAMHAVFSGLAPVIYLANPLLEDIEYRDDIAEVCVRIMHLSWRATNVFVDAAAHFDEALMLQVVQLLHQYVTLRVIDDWEADAELMDVAGVMGLINKANNISRAIPFTEFYNDALNGELFDRHEDYDRFLQGAQGSFCNFPFFYEPSVKAELLKLESKDEQYQEFQTAMIDSLFGAQSCPFLVLKVRRKPYLVNDTLIQVQRAVQSKSLKKPLKVVFVGEEGVDEGGLQKEFFQLLMREMFDPDYGMFRQDPDTRLHWFRASQIDLNMEFELVGTLLGLAIYNSHILEISFPMLTYRKLMGQEVQFSDLAEVQPEIHRSLTKLLEHEGDVEEFGLFFQVEQEADFGEGMLKIDLVPDGSSIPVTNLNRAEYVKLYTAHLLETSIKSQFEAFYKGFMKLCDGQVLKMFRPQELEQLICGGQELDFEALENSTLYDDGFTSGSQVIKWFWECVHALEESRKKRLLFFVTGSDRVPIKGLGSLSPRFIISCAGGSTDRLPSAHTCFNHLLLPQYPNKETLQKLLLLAIDNAEGFGLR